MRSSAAYYERDAHFEKGILVIPAYLAKGVEFDAVLIYDASTQTYDRESERKLFIQPVRVRCIGFCCTQQVIGHTLFSR